MAITLDQLMTVQREMDRLQDRIMELRSAQEVAMEWQKKHGGYEPMPTRGSAESGAVRRASMDLTRVLAELRRH